MELPPALRAAVAAAVEGRAGIAARCRRRAGHRALGDGFGLALGREGDLARGQRARRARWLPADLAEPQPEPALHDVVTLGYVLPELAPAARGPLVDRLWRLCAGVMVVVEPGTPCGYRRILDARDRLIAAGAAILAPCPHDRACPLGDGADWCHFGRRVARSRLHRLAKGGEAPFEDEKFAYVAAARRPGLPIAGRVLRHPRGGGGRVELRLCTVGGVVDRTITRADGALLRIARRLGWGDAPP